jgi:hypothetical protein
MQWVALGILMRSSFGGKGREGSWLITRGREM